MSNSCWVSDNDFTCMVHAWLDAVGRLEEIIKHNTVVLTSMKSARAGMYPAISRDSTESNVGRGGSSLAVVLGKQKQTQIQFDDGHLFVLCMKTKTVATCKNLFRVLIYFLPEFFPAATWCDSETVGQHCSRWRPEGSLEPRQISSWPNVHFSFISLKLTCGYVACPQSNAAVIFNYNYSRTH